MDQSAVLKLFQEAGKTYLDKAGLSTWPCDWRSRLSASAGRAKPKSCEPRRPPHGRECVRKKPNTRTTPEAKQAAQEAANDLFRQAATAYGVAAEQTQKPADKAEFPLAQRSLQLGRTRL